MSYRRIPTRAGETRDVSRPVRRPIGGVVSIACILADVAPLATPDRGCSAATRRFYPGLLATLVVSILITVFFPGGDVGAMNVKDDQSVEYHDFAQLQRLGSPNDWLVAPAEEPAHLRADGQTPRFPLPAEELARRWADLVAGEPRTRILGVSPDGLGVEAEQRSSLFRFVDRVSFRAVALDAGTSSAYVYSRSLVGYWDLGVNQRRVTRWLDMLQQAAHNR